MGINVMGFAISSKVEEVTEITNKLNFKIEDSVEDTYFEKAISNFIEDNEIYITPLEKGTLIIMGLEVPLIEDDYSSIAEINERFIKFLYGETSGIYYLEYYEHNKLVRSKRVVEGNVDMNKGKSFSEEFAGFSDEELVMQAIKKTCGENIFSIEPDYKSKKIKYISGKPIRRAEKQQQQPKNERIKNILLKAKSKNRVIFLLVLTHIFLGIANMITTLVFTERTFQQQQLNYVSLVIFGLLGYMLLKQQRWARIITLILFLISIPLTLLVLVVSSTIYNHLAQLVVDISIIVLLFSSGMVKLYKTKLESSPFEKISPKDIIMSSIGVVIFQLGASDLFLKIGVMKMGLLSGIVSGLLHGLGFYIVFKALRSNYNR